MINPFYTKNRLIKDLRETLNQYKQHNENLRNGWLKAVEESRIAHDKVLQQQAEEVKVMEASLQAQAKRTEQASKWFRDAQKEADAAKKTIFDLNQEVTKLKAFIDECTSDGDTLREQLEKADDEIKRLSTNWQIALDSGLKYQNQCEEQKLSIIEYETDIANAKAEAAKSKADLEAYKRPRSSRKKVTNQT